MYMESPVATVFFPRTNQAEKPRPARVRSVFLGFYFIFPIFSLFFIFHFPLISRVRATRRILPAGRPSAHVLARAYGRKPYANPTVLWLPELLGAVFFFLILAPLSHEKRRPSQLRCGEGSV